MNMVFNIKNISLITLFAFRCIVFEVFTLLSIILMNAKACNREIANFFNYIGFETGSKVVKYLFCYKLNNLKKGNYIFTSQAIFKFWQEVCNYLLVTGSFLFGPSLSNISGWVW